MRSNKKPFATHALAALFGIAIGTLATHEISHEIELKTLKKEHDQQVQKEQQRQKEEAAQNLKTFDYAVVDVASFTNDYRAVEFHFVVRYKKRQDADAWLVEGDREYVSPAIRDAVTDILMRRMLSDVVEHGFSVADIQAIEAKVNGGIAFGEISIDIITDKISANFDIKSYHEDIVPVSDILAKADKVKSAVVLDNSLAIQYKPL